MFEAKKNEKALMQKDQSKNLKIEKVHERALVVSREYLKAEHVLFEIICELDQYGVASYYEYSSLYDYCLKALNLSEAVTCNMIAVARKSKSIPELKAAVMKGEVSVSTARKITPVINSENSFEWISKASTFTKAKLEKAVATEKPKESVYDSARYIAAEILEIKFGIDEKVMEKFKRAQDLVSQKTKVAASFEQTLEAVLDFYLDKQDPLKKAERNIHKSKKTDEAHSSSAQSHNNKGPAGQVQAQDSLFNSPVPGQTPSQAHSNAKAPVPGQVQDQMQVQINSQSSPRQADEMRTQFKSNKTSEKKNDTHIQTSKSQPVPGQAPEPKRHIPAHSQHQVRIRDQNQCTHQNPQGERCPNTRWLEVHHIQGFAQGGRHSPENLTTLCSAHHKQMHHST